MLVGTFGPHNVGNTSAQTHTASVCILFSMIELLLYTGCLNCSHFTTFYIY